MIIKCICLWVSSLALFITLFVCAFDLNRKWAISIHSHLRFSTNKLKNTHTHKYSQFDRYLFLYLCLFFFLFAFVLFVLVENFMCIVASVLHSIDKYWFVGLVWFIQTQTFKTFTKTATYICMRKREKSRSTVNNQPTHFNRCAVKPITAYEW